MRKINILLIIEKQPPPDLYCPDTQNQKTSTYKLLTNPTKAAILSASPEREYITKWIEANTTNAKKIVKGAALLAFTIRTMLRREEDDPPDPSDGTDDGKDETL